MVTVVLDFFDVVLSEHRGCVAHGSEEEAIGCGEVYRKPSGKPEREAAELTRQALVKPPPPL